MPLIFCPECNKKISDRAELCPHCGLPAKYFGTSAKQDSGMTIAGSILLDLSDFRNVLISFDQSYHTLFGANHYISARELSGLKTSFKKWAEQLSEKTNYDYCSKNAPEFTIDMEIVKTCLCRYETLDQDAENHNALYIDSVVQSNKSYFDNLRNMLYNLQR